MICTVPQNCRPPDYIFYIPFSFLFALWRVDTLKVAVESVENKRPDAKDELWYLLSHYFLLLTFFPAQVWVPAVFLSGLISALIVTPTHQSEELFEDYQSDWATAQFRSTRNAVTTNPFSEVSPLERTSRETPLNTCSNFDTYFSGCGAVCSTSLSTTSSHPCLVQSTRRSSQS